MRTFVDGVQRGARELRTSAWESLESHLVPFADEQARVGGAVIEMAANRAAIEPVGG